MQGGWTQGLQVTFFFVYYASWFKEEGVNTCQYFHQDKNVSSHFSLWLNYRDSRRRGKITTGFVYSPWKSGFMRQHNIEMNWRVNPIRSPKVKKIGISRWIH